jgi:hypothetical protein
MYVVFMSSVSSPRFVGIKTRAFEPVSGKAFEAASLISLNPK